MLDLDRLNAAYEKCKSELLAERTPDGHWVGELSSSALSTATAVSALAVVRKQGTGGRGPIEASGRREPPGKAAFTSGPDSLNDLIRRGVAYLVDQQNDDGGFGDTDLSHSNIATTYLVVAALHLAGAQVDHTDLLRRANAYLDAQGRLDGLRNRYGIDKTFVVPIMTNLAIAGLLDWKTIDPLPFELATVPQSWYRFVGMPVVSYAIPALVAIGQAQYFHAPPWNPITRLTRWLSITRSLQVLRRMQPDSGGYLEATPLTSFVVMSLASIGNVEGRKSKVESPEDGSASSTFDLRPSTPDVAAEVIRHGVQFLIDSVRPDGSWPIDTNLATWNTTLAINALAGAGEDVAELVGPKCLDWLLSCQHTKRHPFTGADPGGFGWTDLSGAVPDADDTPGAILALNAWRQSDSQVNRVKEPRRASHSVKLAIKWLFRLQNRNGGWPTFCRGWGKLPFDRSGTDLTAHALRAIASCSDLVVDSARVHSPGQSAILFRRVAEQAPMVGLKFILSAQHTDGSWSPLWFGNQDHPEEDNPVYGTAKVLMAYRDLGLMDSPEAQRGVAWLVANQNEDGGWGSGVWSRLGIGDLGLGISETQQSSPSNPKSQIPNLKSSIEETALAVEALLAACPPTSDLRLPPSGPAAAVSRGLAWLIDRALAGQHRQPAPIGFYFAKLWYYEKLYPLTFTVAALGRARRQFAHPAPLDSPAELARSRAP